MSKICETGATLRNVARAYGPYYQVGTSLREGMLTRGIVRRVAK